MSLLNRIIIGLKDNYFKKNRGSSYLL